MYVSTTTILPRGSIRIPSGVLIGVAATGATVFTLRMAFHATDVSWVNKKDAEPWNYYKDKPYKVPNEIIRLNYFKSTLDDL